MTKYPTAFYDEFPIFFIVFAETHIIKVAYRRDTVAIKCLVTYVLEYLHE